MSNLKKRLIESYKTVDEEDLKLLNEWEKISSEIDTFL